MWLKFLSVIFPRVPSIAGAGLLILFDDIAMLLDGVAKLTKAPVQNMAGMLIASYLRCGPWQTKAILAFV
jgi:hypothetical protein